MIEMKGQYGDAKIFAKTYEQEAIDQIQAMLDSPVAEGTHARFMPDMHAGAGCVIGTTMQLNGRVCPNFVGVDIGCGVLATKIVEKEINFERLKEVCRNEVVSGRHVHENMNWADVADGIDFIDGLQCADHLVNKDWIARSMGTLGGGNHFIAVNQDSNGGYWLTVHSGSRNLGKQVAEYYQRKAEEYHDFSNDDRRALIEICKRNGMETYLSELLPLIKPHKITGLEYLEGMNYNRYLDDMRWCLQWSAKNRMEITNQIFKAMGLHKGRCISTVHNYIDADGMLRKGAVSAQYGIPLLIPLNMRDGVLYCVGKGNKDWNCSAPHGAGRIMSRTAARRDLTLEEFQKSMEDVISDTVCVETIDEAPMAYKDWKEIIELVEPTVEIIDHWAEVFNYKATE